jgi:hypothetical protein
MHRMVEAHQADSNDVQESSMIIRWRPALLLSATIALGSQMSDAAVRLPAPSAAAGDVHPAQFSPIPSSGFMLPAVPMDGLRQSGNCETSLPVFGYPDRQYWPPHGAITMSNDGGWCWIQFSQSYLAVLFTPDATVVEQPEHGRVTVEKMKDRVSVAYQPSPGFAGADRFELRTEGPLPQTIPFAVTVR